MKTPDTPCIDDQFPPNDRPETIVLTNEKGYETHISTFPESALRASVHDNTETISQNSLSFRGVLAKMFRFLQ